MAEESESENDESARTYLWQVSNKSEDSGKSKSEKLNVVKVVKVDMKEWKVSYQVSNKAEGCANSDPFSGVHTPIH